MKDEWCGQNLLVKFHPISADCNPTFFRKGSPVHIRRIGSFGNCGQSSATGVRIAAQHTV